MAANSEKLKGWRLLECLLALPATIRAVLHLIPDLFPLFSPIKGPATANAVFAGQVTLLAHSHD